MTPSKDQSADLDTESEASGVDSPPPDGLFKALANSKRRRLLSLLSTRAEIELDDLTDILVGWEATQDGPASPDEWAQVKIELVHAHLPLLSDVGLITYDDETVARVDTSTAVDEVIQLAGEYEEVTATHGDGLR